MKQNKSFSSVVISVEFTYTIALKVGPHWDTYSKVTNGDMFQGQFASCDVFVFIVLKKIVACSLDLPQVDLLNLTVEKPIEASFLGCEAAEQATKAQEVDLSRLKGLRFRFAPKWRVA